MVRIFGVLQEMPLIDLRPMIYHPVSNVDNHSDLFPLTNAAQTVRLLYL